MVAEKTSLKSRLIINLFLFLFGGFLLITIKFWPSEKTETSYQLSSMKSEDITSLKIARGQMKITMQKQNNIWRINTPFTARVSEFQLDRIFEILEARSSYFIDTLDRGDFGLISPDIIISFNDQTIKFGKINTVTNEQYLEMEGRIFLVPTHLGYSIPNEHSKFISHKILGEDETPISIDFGNWMASQQENGKWIIKGVLDSPEEGEIDLSSELLDQWVLGWEMTSSLGTTPYKKNPSGRKIIVTTRSRKTIEFVINQNEQGYLLIRKDELMAYRVGHDAGNRLFSPHEIALSQN